MEKLRSIFKQEQSVKSKVKLDFSVSREGSNITNNLELIEEAVNKEKVIEFEYTNTYGDKTSREAEPIGVIYKWYAWYMLGYCCNKKDYRMFKVVRMSNLRNKEKSFSMVHDSFDNLLSRQEKQDNRKYMDVKLSCKEEMRISIEEYFPNASITVKEDGDYLYHFRAPDNEMGWKGLLFSFANKIKIIEPDELIKEFLIKAEEITALYK